MYIKKCRYLCIFFGWTFPSSQTPSAGRSAINAVKHTMEKAGVVAQRAAPPSALLSATDMKLKNIETLKFVLASNKGMLLDADGGWKGPRGTLPFWDDRDLRANYRWVMSRWSPKKFDLRWDRSCSMA